MHFPWKVIHFNLNQYSIFELMPSRDAMFEQTVVYLCKLQILLVIAPKKKGAQKNTFASKQYRVWTQIIHILFCCFILVFRGVIDFDIEEGREKYFYI